MCSSDLVHFKKNDVAIPITVLEELDKFKVGNEIKNFAAREVIRFIDKIAGSGNLQDWIKLGGSDLGKFKIVLESTPTNLESCRVKGRCFLYQSKFVCISKSHPLQYRIR